MPIIQNIKFIEDRDFPSGVGNWQGDCYWEAGPIQGRTGILATYMNIGDPDKWITLIGGFATCFAMPEKV